MPKVYISAAERQAAHQAAAAEKQSEILRAAIYGQMKVRKVTTGDLGKIWGMTQQGAAYKVRTGSLSVIDLWKANKLLDFPPDEIVKIVLGTNQQNEKAATPHHRDQAAPNRN